MLRTTNQLFSDNLLLVNKQKGKKMCICCHKEKKVTAFYSSSSSMYFFDKYMPVCKEYYINSVLNKDGGIDFDKFKDLLKTLTSSYILTYYSPLKNL